MPVLTRLVLTRKLNQSIVIGEIGEIEVIVTEIKGDSIRLGIHAPRDVPVHRKEVYLERSSRQRT